LMFAILMGGARADSSLMPGEENTFPLFTYLNPVMSYTNTTGWYYPSVSLDYETWFVCHQTQEPVLSTTNPYLQTDVASADAKCAQQWAKYEGHSPRYFGSNKAFTFVRLVGTQIPCEVRQSVEIEGCSVSFPGIPHPVFVPQEGYALVGGYKYSCSPLVPQVRQQDGCYTSKYLIPMNSPLSSFYTDDPAAYILESTTVGSVNANGAILGYAYTFQGVKSMSTSGTYWMKDDCFDARTNIKCTGEPHRWDMPQQLWEIPGWNASLQVSGVNSMGLLADAAVTLTSAAATSTVQLPLGSDAFRALITFSPAGVTNASCSNVTAWGVGGACVISNADSFPCVLDGAIVFNGTGVPCGSIPNVTNLPSLGYPASGTMRQATEADTTFVPASSGGFSLSAFKVLKGVGHILSSPFSIFGAGESYLKTIAVAVLAIGALALIAFGVLNTARSRPKVQ